MSPALEETGPRDIYGTLGQTKRRVLPSTCSQSVNKSALDTPCPDQVTTLPLTSYEL